MFTLVDFVIILLPLFFLHEFLHYAIAKLLGFQSIALFISLPLGIIALLTEDEGKTRNQEIAIKALPGLATTALAIPFLFIQMPFGLGLIIALAVASVRDFDFAVRAAKAKSLEQYFVLSEADDLKKIFWLRKRHMVKVIVFNQQLWVKHLERAKLPLFS